MKILATAFLALALGASACGGSTAASGMGAAGANGGAATAVAAKLGIDEKYVTMALNAAQSSFAASPKTDSDKAAAAQAGVDQAAAQAQTDGKAITDDQKTGLADALKGML